MNSTINRITKPPLIDRSEVIDALELIVGDNVTELRALNATVRGDRYPTTYSGYFDNATALAGAIEPITTATGIYISPNAVKPELLARSANRIRRTPKGESTSDKDILRRRYLLIDCDPDRPSGISSDEKEHQQAKSRLFEVCDYLASLSFPEPILADSGNGGHALYRVDLPADDGGLIESCLKALSAKFSDAVVKVDTSVHNPARIWKLYGTRACKGDNTSDRPHRMSRIISKPDALEVVREGLLRELAATAPKSVVATWPQAKTRDIAGTSLDVEAFLERNRLDVSAPSAWNGGGTVWTFNHSPLCDHHGDGPYIAQHASGAISAGCHHNSCSWTWQDLRQAIEPKAPPAERHIPRHDVEADNDDVLTSPIVSLPLPLDCFPGAVGAYIKAAAKAIGCDPAFIAMPILATLARAIGNARVIRLKRTWTEPAIIWAAIVGKSGTHKTPSLQAALKFIEARQAKAIADFAQKQMDYQQELAQHLRDLEAWKRSKSTDPPPWKPEEPVCVRYVTTDTTIEALAALLAAQFDGVLVERDELAGWLAGIAEYKGGKGSDLGHWLACWSAKSLTVDRKTGAIKMLHVPRAVVNLIGGIQPGVLRRAIAQEHMQDGLCARILFAMPEPRQVKWTEATVHPDTDAAMAKVFDGLFALESAVDEHGNNAPYPLDLTPEAKAVWVEYFNRHRAELVDLDDDLAAAWSKLEAYAARFALIIQLATDANSTAIDEVAMRSAIELSDWFGNEAKRVYGLFVEDAHDQERRELVDLIRRKGGCVTARELAHGCRRYRAKGLAEAALADLVRDRLGCWETLSPTGKGRPCQQFVLTPVTPVTVTQCSETAELSTSVTVTTVTSAKHETNGHDLEVINRMLSEVEEDLF